MEFLEVPFPHVGWDLHLDEHYGGPRLGSLHPIDDSRDISPCGIDWKDAEAIVGAGLQHYYVNLCAEYPIDTLQRVGAGLATHAGVHGGDRDTGRVGHECNQRRERLVRLEAVASGQTRSDEEHCRPFGRLWGICDRNALVGWPLGGII